jgi:hypothetical protein
VQKLSEKTAIELKYPVTIDGTETGVLYMRRPKVRDQIILDKSEKAGKSSAEREVLYFANLCEIAPENMHELDMADYRKVQAAHGGFLEE